MHRFLAALAVTTLLGGCAVYPDGSLGPLPPGPPVAYAPPPVGYAPPAYGYPPPPVYYAPPPVVVTPQIGLGFYWGPRGYYGRPYRRHW